MLHDSRHDLESFYWVLVWIVLRHTLFEHALGEEACSEVFKFGSDNNAASAKLMWLRKPAITVTGNPPLTELLNGFRKLMLSSVYAIEDMRQPLTYQAVIAIFDTALARDDWPADDEARPYNLLPSVPTVVEGALCAKGKKKKKKRLLQDFQEVASSIPGSGCTTLDSSASAMASKRRRQEAAPLASGSRASGNNRGTASSSRPSARSGPSGARASKVSGGRRNASRGRSGKGSGAGEVVGA